MTPKSKGEMMKALRDRRKAESGISLKQAWVHKSWTHEEFKKAVKKFEKPKKDT